MVSQTKSSRFFKRTNIVFATLHVVLVIVQLVVLWVKSPLDPFFNIRTIGTKSIPVYPVVCSIVVNAMAVIFHIIYECATDHVMENSFQLHYVNHTRWLYHTVTDGLSLMVILLLFKVERLDTLLLVFLVHTGIMATNYYQDQYLRDIHWSPLIAPHTFSLGLYLSLVLFLVMWCMQRLDRENPPQLVVSITVLVFICLIFVIQKIHIYYGQRVIENIELNEDTDSVSASTQERKKTNSSEIKDLETASDLIEQKNTVVYNIIYFELYYYIVSFIVHLLTSALAIDNVLMVSTMFD